MYVLRCFAENFIYLIKILSIIDHKSDAPKNILNLVFERALKELPGSYKLWYNYLKVSRGLNKDVQKGGFLRLRFFF